MLSLHSKLNYKRCNLSKNIIKTANNRKESYKYLSYLVSIYSFSFLLPSILLRKKIDFPYLGDIPISILFTGTYFMLLDIITEVYGYYEAKRTLYAGLITYTIFIFTMEMVISVPSSTTQMVGSNIPQDPLAYDHIFKGVYLVWFSVVVCSLFANTLNIIILSKWKILTNGKYFFLRSVTSSLVTAVLYSTVSNIFAFGIFMHASQISYFIKVTLISISAKLLTLLICAYPATLLSNILKRTENVDAYDYGIDYNFLRAYSG